MSNLCYYCGKKALNNEWVDTGFSRIYVNVCLDRNSGLNCLNKKQTKEISICLCELCNCKKGLLQQENAKLQNELSLLQKKYEILQKKIDRYNSLRCFCDLCPGTKCQCCNNDDTEVCESCGDNYCEEHDLQHMEKNITLRNEASDEIKENVKKNNDLLRKAGKMCTYGSSFVGYCSNTDSLSKDGDNYYCYIHIENLRNSRRIVALTKQIRSTSTSKFTQTEDTYTDTFDLHIEEEVYYGRSYKYCENNHSDTYILGNCITDSENGNEKYTQTELFDKYDWEYCKVCDAFYLE